MSKITVNDNRYNGIIPLDECIDEFFVYDNRLYNQFYCEELKRYIIQDVIKNIEFNFDDNPFVKPVDVEITYT